MFRQVVAQRREADGGLLSHYLTKHPRVRCSKNWFIALQTAAFVSAREPSKSTHPSLSSLYRCEEQTPKVSARDRDANKHPPKKKQ